MRIDGSQNIEPRNLTDGKMSYIPSSKVADGSAASAGIDADATIELAQQPYLQTALSAPEVNTAKIDEARKLLASGELDGPQAARRTAEAMLKLGLK